MGEVLPGAEVGEEQRAAHEPKPFQHRWCAIGRINADAYHVEWPTAGGEHQAAVHPRPPLQRLPSHFGHQIPRLHAKGGFLQRGLGDTLGLCYAANHARRNGELQIAAKGDRHSRFDCQGEPLTVPTPGAAVEQRVDGSVIEIPHRR